MSTTGQAFQFESVDIHGQRGTVTYLVMNPIDRGLNPDEETVAADSQHALWVYPNGSARLDGRIDVLTHMKHRTVAIET